MGVYEVAVLLISVLWFVGCGGLMQGSGSSVNQPTVPSANHAEVDSGGALTAVSEAVMTGRGPIGVALSGRQ